MIAVGVARPSAQGQAITSTPTNDTSPNERACENPRELVPTNNQTASVTKAITRVIGTKTLEILSANA